MFRVWLRPLAGRRVQPHIKLPEQPSHYQAHLIVSQVLADAVPWTIREGLDRVPLVRIEWR